MARDQSKVHNPGGTLWFRLLIEFRSQQFWVSFQEYKNLSVEAYFQFDLGVKPLPQLGIAISEVAGFVIIQKKT